MRVRERRERGRVVVEIAAIRVREPAGHSKCHGDSSTVARERNNLGIVFRNAQSSSIHHFLMRSRAVRRAGTRSRIAPNRTEGEWKDEVLFLTSLRTCDNQHAARFGLGSLGSRVPPSENSIQRRDVPRSAAVVADRLPRLTPSPNRRSGGTKNETSSGRWNVSCCVCAGGEPSQCTVLDTP